MKEDIYKQNFEDQSLQGNHKVLGNQSNKRIVEEFFSLLLM